MEVDEAASMFVSDSTKVPSSYHNRGFSGAAMNNQNQNNHQRMINGADGIEKAIIKKGSRFQVQVSDRDMSDRVIEKIKEDCQQ